MQLFNSLSHLDALPASDLKAHLQARHRTLYEDGLGPVFVIVERTDRIDGPDFFFIGNRGLLSDLYEERAPKEDGFVRPYEWVSHLPELRLYEALYLVNGEDGYWILIPDEIVEAHPDLKWVLTEYPAALHTEFDSFAIVRVPVSDCQRSSQLLRYPSNHLCGSCCL